MSLINNVSFLINLSTMELIKPWDFLIIDKVTMVGVIKKNCTWQKK